LPGFFVSIPFHATSSNKNASIDAPAKTAIDEKTIHHITQELPMKIQRIKREKHNFCQTHF